MNSGVYEISCSVSPNKYIGSTVHFDCRWTEHRRDLRKQRHRNRHLQAAWNKYGADTFSFKIIEQVEPVECVEQEQCWIDMYLMFGIPLYNLTLTAGSTFGMKFGPPPPERIERIRQGNIGKKLSPEHVARIVEANTGRKKTPEEIAKIVAVHTGRKRSAETCAKIGEASRNRITTEEARTHMSEAQIGRVHSPESIRKTAEKLTGRTRPEEHREAMRKGWARKLEEEMLVAASLPSPEPATAAKPKTVMFGVHE